MEQLIKLATIYRILNLYTHNAHNLVKGSTFLQDHSFFNELYTYSDSTYDSLIERYLGLGGSKFNLQSLLTEALNVLSKTDQDFFKTSLTLLKHANKEIESLCKDSRSDSTLSQGTINLLAGIADSSEVFIYKIQQRSA